MRKGLAESPFPPAPPAVPGFAQSPHVATLSELIEQVTTLAQELAGLRAQRGVLQRQISNSSDAATRAALELRKVPLESQMKQVEMDLASVRAQLQSRRTEMTQPPMMPPNMGRRGPDPDLIVGLAFAFIFAVLMPISIAIARRIWRGRKDTGPILEDRLSPRLDRLEQAVDTIAIEIERVSEGQRFVTKVLAERPLQAKSGNAPETHDAAGLNEPKPFLALGAGPIEPIRMAERQAVRQSITPH